MLYNIPYRTLFTGEIRNQVFDRYDTSARPRRSQKNDLLAQIGKNLVSPAKLRRN
jgi:hypothetical protein